MNIEYIEDLIDRENIELINTALKNAKGSYVYYNGIKIILYNNRAVCNSYEKKQVLVEELNHYYYNATYKFNSCLQLISKQEYKAKKATYNMLIPFEKLKLAILNRI